MQLDDAWGTLNELGKLDAIHFIDLHKDKLPHEQKYAATLRNIDDIYKKIE